MMIPLSNLAIAAIPTIVIIFILFKWSLDYKNAIYAVFRMLVQLFLVGYVLAYIFKAEISLIILAVLLVMLLSSSWISLRGIKENKKQMFIKAFIAIIIGGGSTLLLVTQGTLAIDPWFLPSKMIPLAGMIFSNSLNSISLAMDRLSSEMEHGKDFCVAKPIALKTSLIPITNSLFAVGIVSIPGMMTGQILSGVTPLIAARYQIMVMLMIFGSAGISSALFLTLIKSDCEKKSVKE
ncbi:MAG: ABC transporter permease [Candidatus Delongbacteria bacterium]|nr:ABC transporter permease [Candidatus Delongbacteria bacterium]